MIAAAMLIVVLAGTFLIGVSVGSRTVRRADVRKKIARDIADELRPYLIEEFRRPQDEGT